MIYPHIMPIVADISLEVMRHLALQPPAIVRSLSDIIGGSDTMASERAWLRKKEAAIDEWIATGARKRKQIWKLASETAWTDVDTGFADRLIDDLDQNARGFSADLERALGYRERGLRKLKKKIAPSEYRELKFVLDEGIRIAAKEIDEKFEFATFIRALRAEFSPKAEGDVLIETPEELEAYLDALDAA